MITEKLSNTEKKKMVRKMKSLLNTASRISNVLIGEENLHSRNQDHLYAVRTEVDSCIQRLDYVKYK